MSRTGKILSVIAVVAAWTVVATSSASAADCGPVDTQVTGLSEAQMESSIGCLINEQRTSFGLQPVNPNADLRQAALSHSDEMISQSYFEHTSPAGLTFVNRIQSTGYMHSVRNWVVGENLVWGTGPRSTPQALVTAWMNSPPHRANLLRPSFREIGIAAVPGTPESVTDTTGVTVSSEYGNRTFAKGNRKHRGSKAKAKKSAHKHKRKHRRAKH
ncbi:MAG: hypothetical protein QOD14_371 [Solirubrobacterales bacterium]|nr:hypothetical protein [Solirubrobacterales bacterium]